MFWTILWFITTVVATFTLAYATFTATQFLLPRHATDPARTRVGWVSFVFDVTFVLFVVFWWGPHTLLVLGAVLAGLIFAAATAGMSAYRARAEILAPLVDHYPLAAVSHRKVTNLATAASLLAVACIVAAAVLSVVVAVRLNAVLV